ncbi:hypothetical protein CLOM_g56 [Closterium sp. NIES-68]|nr:hypothetical protein CLOM_g56 [Closterium sp. NIES-68]GJP73534.1 hypothetical protein CLOP_g4235 [Closterium sp. NIES-67]
MSAPSPKRTSDQDGSGRRDARLLDSRVLPQCLDAVEFCPARDFPATFAVASYQLVETQRSDGADVTDASTASGADVASAVTAAGSSTTDTETVDDHRQSRLGGVHLFRIDVTGADVSDDDGRLPDGKEPPCRSAGRMVHLQSVSGCGILDIKWRREGYHGVRRGGDEGDGLSGTDLSERREKRVQPILLAAATADGTADLYEMKRGQMADELREPAPASPSLSLSTRIPFPLLDSAEPDAKPPMCLALDWWTAGEAEGGGASQEEAVGKAGETEGEGADGEDMGERRREWGVRDRRDRIAVSRSDGSVAVARQGEDGAWVGELAWPAHEYEAWTCCFNIWQPEVLYSGGDDCAMCAWDLRTHIPSSPSSSPLSPSSSRPAWRNIKAHRAGVTTLRCSPHSPHLLASGSYDEVVRFWDVRMPSMPIAVCQVPTGGGVWRLKWHPEKAHIVLAACMHGGATILSLSQDRAGAVDVPTSPAKDGMRQVLQEAGSESFEGLRGEVVEQYEQHKSMVYGIDWGRCNELQCSANEEDDEAWIVGTCSFYDKLLHVWKPHVL